MKIVDFILGKKPQCVAPRFKHTPVKRVGKATYCLWCKRRLDERKN